MRAYFAVFALLLAGCAVQVSLGKVVCVDACMVGVCCLGGTGRGAGRGRQSTCDAARARVENAARPPCARASAPTPRLPSFHRPVPQADLAEPPPSPTLPPPQPAWSDASAVAAAVTKVNNTKNLIAAARPKNLTVMLGAKVASLNSTKAALAASIGADPAKFINVIGDKAAFITTAKTALDVEVALAKIETASKACVKTPAE